MNTDILLKTGNINSNIGLLFYTDRCMMFIQKSIENRRFVKTTLQRFNRGDYGNTPKESLENNKTRNFTFFIYNDFELGGYLHIRNNKNEFGFVYTTIIDFEYFDTKKDTELHLLN
jgi:hypothetical protein